MGARGTRVLRSVVGAILTAVAVTTLSACGAEPPCLYGPYCESHKVTVENDCGETIEWVLSEAEQLPQTAWQTLDDGDKGDAKTRFEDPDVHVRLPEAPEGDVAIPWALFAEVADVGDGPLVLEGGSCPVAGALDTPAGG